MTQRRSYAAELKELRSVATAPTSEHVARTLALLLPLALVVYASGNWIPLTWIPAYFLVVTINGILLSRYRQRDDAAFFYFMLSINTTGALIFVTLPIYLWYQPSLLEKLFSILALSGGIIHVLLLRTTHRSIHLTISLPVFIAIFAMCGVFLPPENSIAEFVAALVCVGALLAYFVIAVRHYMQSNLKLTAAIKRAEDANRTKGEFLAMMSHEIRTPLNGILGLAQLLRTRQQGEQEEEKVGIILRSARNLQRIVDDLLDFSKIEAGALKFTPEPARIDHEIEEVIALFSASAQEKNLELRGDWRSDVPPLCEFDAGRVRQCIGNLVSNAVKFTDAGQIVLRAHAIAERNGGYQIVIAVEDTGAGITPAKLATLFTRFRQLESARRFGRGGTGLGLAISREIARAMGGDVIAESTPGVGSVFTFTFMASRARNTRVRQAQTELPPEKAGLAILIVDDTATNRFVARAMLESDGHRCFEADDGHNALALLDRQDIDVVLLDMYMPRMDGRKTITAIRSSTKPWSSVPVIAVTADTISVSRQDFLDLGMSGLVTKPLEIQILRREISLCIADRERSNDSMIANDTG